MGAVKRSFDRSNVMVSSTGSANAYVLTYSQPPEGYVTGEIYRFFANFTNTAAPTLNINGLGTRPLLRADGSAMAANEIVQGQVVSVVVSGNNFLHQPVGTRYFTDDVSIQKASDSVLALEDTSAPATSFRQKKIYSTKNAGGGNDWLFRQVRPSDGASQDFTLSGSAPGTIWTTGNFNPALKADLAGAAFSGAVSAPILNMVGTLTLAGTGTNQFQAGNGDAATYATHNVRMLLWNGLGLSTYDGSINGFYDARAGRWDTKAAPRVNGTDVWHPGNFNPGTKADLNAVVNFGGVGLNAGGSNTYVYTDTGSNNFVVRTGAPGAYRYSSIDPAGNFTAAAGGIFNGDLSTSGRFIVGRGQPSSQIIMTDSDEGDRSLHNNSGWIGFLGSDGAWKARVNDAGQFWTSQLGDLNSRIENRASDFAIARSNERVAKTGDTMSGGLYIDMNYPFVQLTNRDGGGFAYMDFCHVPYGHGDFTWRLKHSPSDNRFNIEYVNGAKVTIGTSGEVWTAQIGDLNTRIEDRAAAWSRNAVQKTGDTMSGDLVISKEYPNVTFLWGGRLRSAWQLREDNRLYYINLDNGDAYMSIGTDGSVWTKQIGDINGRIEQRCADFANDRLNTATNRINNKSARLAYVGELNCGNYGTNMAEPWGGGVITGLQSNNGSGYATGGRGRQLQMSDSNGNWYACGYV
ncbi:hypothetical protein J4O73_02390 [Methylobacterium sp. NFXW15]